MATNSLKEINNCKIEFILVCVRSVTSFINVCNSIESLTILHTVPVCTD